MQFPDFVMAGICEFDGDTDGVASFARHWPLIGLDGYMMWMSERQMEGVIGDSQVCRDLYQTWVWQTQDKVFLGPCQYPLFDCQPFTYRQIQKLPVSYGNM